ncbi:MAG TPA: HAD hydrolase family protein [Gaiellaceae bacterium]|nr:HAD hydrolase family protein [Gaiellaceae bacterium]
MTIGIEIPGRGELVLEHLVLDVNGTLAHRGALLEDVAAPLARVGSRLRVHLLSADTFGTLAEVAAGLGLQAHPVRTGEEKAEVVAALGAARCAAIGNGANDAAMLRAAALGIAVLGPEGAAGSALAAADVVCASAQQALELLLDERGLAATLRA